MFIMVEKQKNIHIFYLFKIIEKARILKLLKIFNRLMLLRKQ